ncbi:hypothetical protein PG993_010258 [Apiospora rasikravindrae]|uniref:Uncharacterized protein n=1 Tax=Apiospora rasikravindrae TaxID=990691 RepID=A0ABR1SLQ5_9PEZI
MPDHQSRSTLGHRTPSPSFVVYSISPTGRHYMLGETETKPPLYAVSFHAGWTGPDVELHSGLNETDPPLATAKRGSLIGGDSATIKLPGLPNDDGTSGETVKEQVTTSGDDFPYPSYDFTIEVGSQREKFEWQHVGMRTGWQLARLSNNEAVAHFEWTNLTKKELYFQFVGSGATGALGERWAVMAVITAIRAWDRVRRRQGSGTTAATIVAPH